MSRAYYQSYYGVPGTEEEDGYYEYEKVGVLEDREEEVSPSVLQTLIVFLIGLPFLPLWSGISLMLASWRVRKFSESNPEEAARWASFIPVYRVFFFAGLAMYYFLISYLRHNVFYM